MKTTTTMKSVRRPTSTKMKAVKKPRVRRAIVDALVKSAETTYEAKMAALAEIVDALDETIISGGGSGTWMTSLERLAQKWTKNRDKIRALLNKR